MKFTEFEKLMSNKGINSLAKIARALATTPQAVSNWKARDQVPYHIINKLNENNTVTNKLKGEPLLQDNTLSFSDILITLAEQLKVIILIFFITVFLTFTYVMFIQEEKYVSFATVLFPDNKSASSAGGLAGIASQFGLNIPMGSGGGDLSSPRLLPELMRSRTFANNLLKKEFYTEKYGKKLPLSDILNNREKASTFNNDKLTLNAFNILNDEYLEFNQDPNSTFSIISVFAPEPVFARDLAAEVVVELEALNRYFKNQNVSQKIIFIESRIASVESELKKSEQALKSFNEQNRQISSPSLQLELDRFTRDLEVQKEVYLTLKQQQELAKIDAIQEISVFQVLDGPEIPLGPSNKNLRASLIIAIVFGLGLGVIIAFLRGYVNNSDLEERKKIRRGKNFFRKKAKDFLFDRRITGAISMLLLLGLPFYLSYKSHNPVFFGMYSPRLMFVNSIYIITLLFSSGLFFYSKKKK